MAALQHLVVWGDRTLCLDGESSGVATCNDVKALVEVSSHGTASRLPWRMFSAPARL